MRFTLGILIILVVGAFTAWALWKALGPRKRQRGMRIEFRNRRIDPDA